MARAGISYSQVAAAAKLAAAGTNPTVDTVRTALGDTGSKGTIAPMLKRWKLEHEGETIAAETGLPSDLLEAVKGVYLRVEAGAQGQIELARAAHDQAMQEAMKRLEIERVDNRQLRAERDVVVAQLTETKVAFAHERDERQHAAVTMAALRAENEGLTQRLAGESAEVQLLVDQLTQSRRQFDHFQEKTVEQKEKERLSFEVRITLLEKEVLELRVQLQEQQQSATVLRIEKKTLLHQIDLASVMARETEAEINGLPQQSTAARDTPNDRVRPEDVVRRKRSK